MFFCNILPFAYVQPPRCMALRIRSYPLSTQGASKETSGSFGRYICIFCLTTQGASKGRPWSAFLPQRESWFSGRPNFSVISCCILRAHGARVPRAGIRAEGRQARPRLYRSALHGGRDATAQTPGGINLTVTVTVSNSNFSTFHARTHKNFYFFKLHFTFLYKSTSEICCSLLLLLPSSPFHFAF